MRAFWTVQGFSPLLAMAESLPGNEKSFGRGPDDDSISEDPRLHSTVGNELMNCLRQPPLLVALLLLLLCGNATAQGTGPLELTFGLYLTDKATVVYAKFKPAIDYLEKDLSRRLHRPVKITLSFSKTYDAAIQALVQGKVDFVRFGPASYVTAKKRNKKVKLLAMEQRKGKKRFNGVLIVAKDSPIRTLADIKDKRFAFGDRNSTIGRYLAQDLLQNAGIHSHHLQAFAFLGRHDRVAKAVELGDFDVGSVKNSTYKKVNKSGNRRVLATFENVTKPWIARGGLDPEIHKVLSVSLQSLKDKEVLRALKVSGLIAATDSEYAFVRAAMKRALDFEKE